MSLVLSPDGRLFYSHDFKREGHEQKEEQVVQLEVDRVLLPGADGFETFMAALMGIGQLAAGREADVAQQNQFTEQLNGRICWVAIAGPRYPDHLAQECLGLVEPAE